MGSRSATETVVGIFVAFLEQKTWQQAELAERLSITTRALRERLEELRDVGKIPLEREEDLPHVFWSVPMNWVPGGLVLSGEDAGHVLRLLARLPQSDERDRFLRRFTGHSCDPLSPNETPLRINEQILSTIERAASLKQPLRFSYFTTSRGSQRTRVASVHSLHGGDRWRFVATCHDRKQLCWFRVDNVSTASLASEEQFLAIEPERLERFQVTSIDGFAVDGKVTELWFNVRYPEARWVRTNLPNDEKFRADEGDEGVRFSCTTTAFDVVARFVVGLGGAVTDCSSDLRERVLILARQIERNLEANPVLGRQGETNVQ